MTNFQYDQEYASDYQLTVCSFSDSGGVENAPGGSEFSADQIKITGTDEFAIITSDYASALLFTFQACKIDANHSPAEISAEEFSKINRWVNRKESHKFKIDSAGYEHIYFMGRFNIQAVKIKGILYGIEFTFISDYPYGFMDEITNTYSGKEFMVYNHSDETGDIYPYTVIKCLESGDLRIVNSMDSEEFELKNCSVNEIITVDNKHRVITSSDSNHDLNEDFNFNYIKLCNTYGERRNNYTSSFNIEMEIKYSPIRKVGI